MKASEDIPRSGLRSLFYRGLLFTGFGTVVNISLLFVETMIIVRILTPVDYGVYVLLVAIVNFFTIAVDFGCKSTVVRMIASSVRSRQEALVGNVVAFRMIVVVVISCLVLVGHSLLSLLDPSWTLAEYTVYIPLMVAAASFDELLTAVLQGFQFYFHMAAAQVIRSVLRISLTVLLLTIFKLGTMALIFSWTLSFAISVTYQFLVLPGGKSLLLHRPLLGEMLRFGLPLQGTRLLWFVFGRIDVLLIGALAGPSSVAFYGVAARIPDALQRLSESYIAIYFPTMSALWAEKRKRQADLVLNHSIRLISFTAALMALVAVVFSRQIVVLVFSEKYASSSPAFALLMIGLQMTFIVNMMGYTLTSAGYSGRSLGEDVSRTVLNVVGDLILIPIYGFVGPAFATVTAVYAANPVAVWLLRRSNIAVSVGPYAKQTLLLLLFSASYWWLQPVAIAYRLAIILLFVVANYLFSTITAEDLGLVLPERIITWARMRKEVVADGR